MAGTQMTSSATGTSGNFANLGDLMTNNDLLVKQTMGGCCACLCETCGCCEAPQTYNIAPKGTPKKDFLFAREDSSCFTRCCCGTNRCYDLDVYQGTSDDGMKLLHMHRPLACPPGCICTLCCCNQEMKVFHSASNNKYMGRAFVPWYCCKPEIHVQDQNNNTIYEIEKDGCCPCVIFECCRQPFTIKNMEGDAVGKIDKEYGGAFKELFTDNDTFTLKYPGDADASRRALLLGATFLMDIAFFESDKKDDPAK